jgi:predicted metal-dependent phosphoesterase TrpH
LIRVDLHVHSAASFDCQVKPESVAARCRQIGLSRIGLTDHNTISGALELRGTSTDLVIVGEEIMSADGELIGLFLSEAVEPGLTAVETASRIKSQGGLIYLEHPADPHRRHLREEAIEALGEQIDIVEVWNGRSDTQPNRKALDLCEVLGAAPGAGSDAHTLGEIGAVFVEMEEFEGAQDFLTKLRAGRIRKRRSKLALFSR